MSREFRKRPEWLNDWLNYPHGTLSEAQAREVTWFAAELAERVERLELELQAGAEVMQRQDDRLVDSESQLIAANDKIAELEAQNRELLEALQIYADEKNWNCPRRGKRDSLNCFMGRWTGPVDKGDEYSGVGHGYDTARAALARATGPAAKEPEGAKQ